MSGIMYSNTTAVPCVVLTVVLTSKSKEVPSIMCVNVALKIASVPVIVFQYTEKRSAKGFAIGSTTSNPIMGSSTIAIVSAAVLFNRLLQLSCTWK